MRLDNISAILSLGAALIVAFASYGQWWNVSYNSKFSTKPWVKVTLGIVIALLLAALIRLLLDG